MEAFPQQQKTADLDSAPPRPPAAEGRNLMSMSVKSPTDSGGVGSMANSPTLMTLQGMAMVKQGFQLIANGLPALSQLLSNTTMDLEKMVTMGIADTVAGTQPQINAPPGVAPMMPPPPGAAGPPPAGPPGMAGMPGAPPRGMPPGMTQ